ncbi:MAG: hypothetical protein LW878_06690 [Proteobacteria bacterium]|jgi:hypothetical protein|nr:hypothetical protein [Pseudomonadota bacterium]
MLIFIFATLALATQQVEKFCFASKMEALKAQGQIEFILIKNQDKTLLEEDCLTVAVGQERVELVQRWIKSHYPAARLSFSSSSPSTEECRLKFKKLSRTQLKSQGAGLNQQRVNVQAGVQMDEAQDIRMIRTLSGKKAVLELDRFRLSFICTYHSSQSYTLEIKGETIPLPPRITSTTVTAYGATQTIETPAQNIQTIESTLSLRKNEEINLGQIFKNLDNKSSDLNLQNPSLASQEGESIEQWFVSLY